MKNIIIICSTIVTIVLVVAAAVLMVSCGHGKYPQGGPYYFGGFSGYDIPFMPIERLTEEEAKSRPAYYVADFGYKGKIISFTKYLNGKKEFSDKYIYTYDAEYLERRELTVSNGDIQTDYFDKDGKISRTEKETRAARIKRLIVQLEDNVSWDAPLVAAGELAELDAKDALPDILKALENGKRVVCCCGGLLDSSIIKLGGRAVIPDMLKLLKNKNGVIRMAAVNVLSGVGAKETIPEIKKLSNDPDEGVRGAVSNALNELDNFIQIKYNDLPARTFTINNEMKNITLDKLTEELSKHSKTHPDAKYEYLSDVKLTPEGVKEIRAMINKAGIKLEHFWVPVSDVGLITKNNPYGGYRDLEQEEK